MSLFSQEPKSASNWNVAATHYLTGGLVAPALISGIVAFGLSSLTKAENSFLSMVTGFIVNVLALWLGVIYSKNYLNRTYVISDRVRVVNLSTIYYLIANYIFIGLFYSYNFIYVVAISLSGRQQTGHLTKAGDLAIMASVTLIETYIFYLLSKKYLLA
jgi:hypothetical protein